jgi:hypothetical protein
MGFCRFGQRLILPQAVPADRGAADQDARPVLQALDQAHDIAGHADPGIDNLAALGFGP